MSRKRSISSDISTDPKLAILAEEHGPLPLLIYTWAIPHANDYGRIVADPVQFRLLVCPALPIKSKEIADAIRQIEEVGLWRLSMEDGRECLQFPENSWFRHQSYINSAKRQETPKIIEKVQGTAQNRVSPTPSPSPSPSPIHTLPECVESAPTPTPDVENDERPGHLIRAAAALMRIETLSSASWRKWRPVATEMLRVATEAEILEALSVKLASKADYNFVWLEGDLDIMLPRIRGQIAAPPNPGDAARLAEERRAADAAKAKHDAEEALIADRKRREEERRRDGPNLPPGAENDPMYIAFMARMAAQEQGGVVN